MTVQPTGRRFIDPPTIAKRRTPVPYTTAPIAGVNGALLDGYRAMQTLGTDSTNDSVPPPQPCSGTAGTLTVTFHRGGGSRTVTVQETSTPARSIATATARGDER